MVEDVLPGREKESRIELLVNLEEDSEYLERLRGDVTDILGKLKIVSFYEAWETPTVERV